MESEISSSVAKIVLRLLPRIPRTEWRNRIIPFPAIYKKVGYVMKLDRRTTRKTLELLSLQNKIRMVNFHGVILEAGSPGEMCSLEARPQDGRVLPNARPQAKNSFSRPFMEPKDI